MNTASFRIAGISLLLSCSTSIGLAADLDQVTYDPAEALNRKIFAVNQFIDGVAIRPIARGYRNHVSGFVQTGVRNFTGNLEEPGILANDLLQANPRRAWNTAQRVAINTTVGVGGLVDVAQGWDRPRHKADFGQTLGVWGVGPGPAVQLPLFGPSNLRDGFGKFAGSYVDPTRFIKGDVYSTVETVAGGLDVVDGRAEILPLTDELARQNTDQYAALRDAAASRRAKLVAEAKAGLVEQ